MFSHFLKDEDKQSIIKRSLSQKGPQHVRGHSAASLVHKQKGTSSIARPSTNQASKATKTMLPKNPKQLPIEDSAVPFMYESRSVKKPKYDVDDPINIDTNNDICSNNSNHVVQTEPSSRVTTTTYATEESRTNPTTQTGILPNRQQKTLETTVSSETNQDGGDQEKQKDLIKKKKKASKKQVRGDSAAVDTITTTSFTSKHLLRQQHSGSTATSQMNAFLLISPYSDNLNSFLKYLPDSRRYRLSTSPNQPIQLSKRSSLTISTNNANASRSSCSSTSATHRNRTNVDVNNNNNNASTPNNVKLIPLSSRPALNQLRSTAAAPVNPRKVTRATLLVDVERSPPARSPIKIEPVNVPGSETKEEASNTRRGNRAQPRSFSIDCAHLLKNNNSANRLTYSTQFPFLERSTYLAGISPKSQSQSSAAQSPLRSRMGQSELIERTHANSSEIYQRSEPSPKQPKAVLPTTSPSSSGPNTTNGQNSKQQAPQRIESTQLKTAKPAATTIHLVTENESAARVKVKAQKMSNNQGVSKQVIIKRIPRQSVDRIYNNRIIHMIEPITTNNVFTAASIATAAEQPSNKLRKKSPNNNAKSKRTGSNPARVKSEINTPSTNNGELLPEEVPAFNAADIVINQKSDSHAQAQAN